MFAFIAWLFRQNQTSSILDELAIINDEAAFICGTNKDDALDRLRDLSHDKHLEWTRKLKGMIDRLPVVSSYNEGSKVVQGVSKFFPEGGPTYKTEIFITSVGHHDNDCYVQHFYRDDTKSEGTCAVYCRRGHYLAYVSVHLCNT